MLVFIFVFNGKVLVYRKLVTVDRFLALGGYIRISLLLFYRVFDCLIVFFVPYLLFTVFLHYVMDSYQDFTLFASSVPIVSTIALYKTAYYNLNSHTLIVL